MILTRLKHETQASHEALEAAVDLRRRIASPTDYRRLLEDFWGFYAPYEQRVMVASAWAGYAIDLPARLKAPALARDLQALGLSPEQVAALPRCEALPKPTSLAYRAGCMYVMEGATLGGQLIARELRGGLGIGSLDGGAFFASYGDQVGPMWRAFRAIMLEVAVDAASEAALLRGAHETFAAFGTWLNSGAHPYDSR